MQNLATWLNSALLVAIILILLKASHDIDIRVAVIERDLEWIRATLTKWGMISPKE